MRSEILERVIEASKYQKQAIQALFPESANRHFEVIEHEMKELFTEGVMEIANIAMQHQSKANSEEDIKQTNGHQTSQENVDKTKTSKSKKVNID